MPHRIQTFRAATMDEALDRVRRELGNDAIVLESKTVATRGLLPWPSTRQEIEVCAERISRQPTSRQALVSKPKPSVAVRTVQTLAESMASKLVSPALLAPIPELAAETVDDSIANRERLAPPPQWLTSGIRTASRVAPAKPVEVEPKRTSAASASVIEVISQAGDRPLDSLQTIVTRLEQQSRPRGLTDVPTELFQQYLKLVEAGIDDDVARDLIATLHRHTPIATQSSPTAVATMLTAFVEREMRCAPPIRPQPGRRESVMLIGPTGVGKTTTLAKLAGQFQIRAGRRVGLITIDSYRVGAVEQLRSYAEILQVPFRTASTPDELRSAMDDLEDVDLILIDTAGRSPWDNPKLEELREIARVAAADHVLLVLSLAGGAKSLSKIAESFSAALPTSLILTKLDEAVGYGGLLTIAREIAIPVSYVTTGQDVPDQIEPAHPSRLARLIVGCDRISS